MGEVRVWVLAYLKQKIAECREVATHAPGAWHWVDVDTDLPTLPEEEHWRLSLRTVEDFRETTVGPLPEFILYMVEFDGQDKAREYAAHLAAHDATRMLAVYEWMRQEVHRHQRVTRWNPNPGGPDWSEEGCRMCGFTGGDDCPTVLGLATSLGRPS